MAGTTGERPLGDIVTDPQFWLLHLVNFPAVFLSGWLFVSTGLAYDIFGTPRPNQYYPSNQIKIPIVTERMQAKQEINQYLQQFEQTAPPLN
ncbi:MAG: cytochrome b559 subunit alpha [Leptolyngbya sp. SIO1E4]|nr:cytochrome b559 subunit alpha [Leptolyngbya sp. SIO1E4]